MHTTQPVALPLEVSDFAVTHCMRCEAGWTRHLEGGRKAIVCLLDREPVLRNMTSCDRYELRRQEE